ncbi:AAA family ATPase [Mesomycoplasma lagogenitalium]|uniref:AAA family ATPase n=1 Tax=Mesomycoplasma lagogenitalium TaxID=171286 RepID=A0ABY8LTQ5_9BACT|nr:AAA family ATPase [Mesomycoplasma lagogenitalium]WGI36620.1 AAA family ATPase [Mesomycoplasma lagogenitalium]
MKTVEGKIKKILFASDKSDFFIFLFEDLQKNIYKIKSVEKIILNNRYLIEIQESKNEKYPDTWELNKIQPIAPSEKSEVINYFSSSVFKGIGKKVAEDIYDKLGDNAVLFLKKKPNEIFNVGISKKKAQTIFDILTTQDLETEILDFFNVNKLSKSFYKKLKNNFLLSQMWNELKENPYSLLNFDDNIFLFEEVDEFALALGFSHDNLKRLKYLILNAFLKYFEDSGNTYINSNIKIIFNYVKRTFPITDEYFKEIVKMCINEKFLFYNPINKSLTLKNILKQELFIYEKLDDIFKKENSNFKFTLNIPNYLDDIQESAIKTALNQNLTIITGGPGTGKTELLKHIWNNLKNKYEKSKIAVLAPTGRAAFRITEKSFANAKTIHSFLEAEKEENVFVFKKESTKNINVLIIDEFSMINTSVFYSLLKGIKINELEKIILIGDNDQLPAIGYGNLLSDFINSGYFNVIKLENNYRQKDKMQIINDAQKANLGILPDFNSYESDFIEITEENFVSVFENEMDNYLKLYKIENITIIAPFYKGIAGIDNVNLIVQSKIFNNNQDFFIIKNQKFFINDKVIQNENDSELNVFNGEIGIIEDVAIYKEEIKFIIVKFANDKKIKYTKKQFEKYITLAYCISVHKFQGSESPVIIMLIFNNYKSFLTRKLIYTGMTRAQEFLKLIGEKEVLEFALKNIDIERNTNLRHLFKK